MATARENVLMRMGKSEAEASLVSLKRGKAEKKADSPMAASTPYEGEDYPYGTRLELNEDQLDKLGIDDLKAGEKVHIVAEGKVTSVNESSNDNGDGKQSRCNVCIQITKMAIK